ncbi:helix-turn-helix domain-containing protein [Aliidiomarina halalkaliphila]|uniref:Helix-turn-helix domain-containing protein n=1 Tax=Aliidiomarina halalkaliphila TaxID=2593535 RepID=A0A552X210_9GAMM|nr:helix-turn-helix domain-containing protein [Aliidiomarina halalkaliphila]TRW48919.1 helix-turn-helix domain-containing protein [Aliidiomarina halalkaliphila]
MSVNQHDMSRQSPDDPNNTSYSLISIKEAAKIAHVTERTVNRLIASNEIQSVKSGKRRFIWRDSILTWSRHRTDTTDPSFEALVEEIHRSIEELKTLSLASIELYHPSSLSDIKAKLAIKERINQ